MQKGSGSEFYTSHPSEKIVGISDIPSEFTKSRYASAFSSYGDFNPILSENEHNLSDELGAIVTPHYRTDSVECHPSDNTWSARLNRLARE